MSAILGSGEFKYEVMEGWGKLPDGWTFKEVAAVAVDKKDQVYCFTRGAHPIIVFDREGSFLRSWGENVFRRAHGATMAPVEPSSLLTTATIQCESAPSTEKFFSPLVFLASPRRIRAASHLTDAPTWLFLPKGNFTSPMAMATRGCTNILRMASCCFPGANPVAIPDSSISSTTFALTKTVGFMSPIEKIIASKYSTATVNTRPSGTICTGPALSTWTRRGKTRFAMSESLAPVCPSTRSRQIWVIESISMTRKANG